MSSPRIASMDFKFQTPETLAIPPFYICRISLSKAYDSVSGDTLYFELKILSAAGNAEASANIIIVCNPNYHYSDFLHPLRLSREIYGYTLSYDLHTIQNGTLFRINGYGEIKETRETVYITFTQISKREDNETFFAFIQNTIRKK